MRNIVQIERIAKKILQENRVRRLKRRFRRASNQIEVKWNEVIEGGESLLDTFLKSSMQVNVENQTIILGRMSREGEVFSYERLKYTPTFLCPEGIVFIGYDFLGGIFAVKEEGMGDRSPILYFPPDSYRWIDFVYTFEEFLDWVCSGDVEHFYCNRYLNIKDRNPRQLLYKWSHESFNSSLYYLAEESCGQLCKC